MVLTCIENSLQYWRPIPDSFATFLAEHIIFWYCNMKKSKSSNHKICACKIKNIWLVYQKIRSSISDYSFSTTFMKFVWKWLFGFTFLRMVMGKIWRCSCWEKVTLSWLINSNMVKPEKFDHLHLLYHFTVLLKAKTRFTKYFFNKKKTKTKGNLWKAV